MGHLLTLLPASTDVTIADHWYIWPLLVYFVPSFLVWTTFYNEHSQLQDSMGCIKLLHSVHKRILTLIQYTKHREMCCKILIQVTKKLSFKKCHGWNCRRPVSSRPMGTSYKTQSYNERRMSYRKGTCFRITAIIFSENIDAYNDAGNMVVMVALRMMVRGRTRVSHWGSWQVGVRSNA